ncbi:hypothetical protein SISNIDRAFT_467947 [Sistotremastrum niveocremeum HHB9708]|uniref:Ribonuclease H1 N-terminal domain-containing protein n=1 Tax=Sistotremastrum niveocremeum HHB9708 TaxID=1314777 RepID=A0A164RZB1_9AGAM|nr:hypothetical protein SISNIDRAFT_467947 [Sistotremastrum niveocremeum HHB9708]
MPRHWAVLRGTNPGVYDNWADAKEQVDGFPDGYQEKFESHEEAISLTKSNTVREQERKLAALGSPRVKKGPIYVAPDSILSSPQGTTISLHSTPGVSSPSAPRSIPESSQVSSPGLWNYRTGSPVKPAAVDRSAKSVRIASPEPSRFEPSGRQESLAEKQGEVAALTRLLEGMKVPRLKETDGYEKIQGANLPALVDLYLTSHGYSVEAVSIVSGIVLRSEDADEALFQIAGFSEPKARFLSTLFEHLWGKNFNSRYSRD